MEEIGNSIQLRLLDIPENLQSDREIEAYHLRTQMMAQTTAIRNWAYPHQMQRVVIDLARQMKIEFEEIIGIDPVRFIEALFKLTEERNDILNEHLNKVRSFGKKKDYREMIAAYNLAFPENEKIEDNEVEQIWTSVGSKMSYLLGMLVSHSDLKLGNIYSFELDHFTTLYGECEKRGAIKAILDSMSYCFGDLKEYPKEHIILSNPVHVRPFIKLEEERYFTTIYGIFPHLYLSFLENLLTENEALRKNYSNNIKSKYLEDEIRRLFRDNFPNAKIFSGSQWQDPISNKTYENDLTIVIDTFAIIVEAKSGSVTPPAQRGAPDRLFKTIVELIEEPSEQAHRFISALRGKKEVHVFTTRRGENNVIDSSKIKYYIPLGVTLANFGSISGNLKKIVQAGITEKKIGDLAPSVSLTDLESVFKLLPLEAEKIHYLARRREVEDHFEYEGDELDLLAFYLDNGFNIGDAEYDGDIALALTMKSKELDPYFIGVNEGASVVKPTLSMTKWWNDILNVLADRKPQNWIETSFMLLNSTKQDQEIFERRFNKLCEMVRSGKVKKKHNWVVFLSGPKRRRFFIAGYAYAGIDKEERNKVMSSILNSEEAFNTRGVVLIALDVNMPSYPYTAIAGKLDSDLFDVLSTSV